MHYLSSSLIVKQVFFSWKSDKCNVASGFFFFCTDTTREKWIWDVWLNKFAQKKKLKQRILFTWFEPSTRLKIQCLAVLNTFFLFSPSFSSELFEHRSRWSVGWRKSLLLWVWLLAFLTQSLWLFQNRKIDSHPHFLEGLASCGKVWKSSALQAHSLRWQQGRCCTFTEMRRKVIETWILLWTAAVTNDFLCFLDSSSCSW